MKSLIPVTNEHRLFGRQFSPLTALQQEIDRLFDGFGRGFSATSASPLLPNMDVSETEKEIEITAELPGLEEKDVQLNVADNLLTIRGEKKSHREEKEKDYRLVERSYGSFQRTIELPNGVNPDSIQATISKGVLKVVVPKPAPAQTKKIAVKTAA
ncbi:MAG: Hsp20/alpha crystallin family protein [Afipia sp.]